jgi:hypothetical protein
MGVYENQYVDCWMVVKATTNSYIESTAAAACGRIAIRFANR